jgi:hypothetical protein
MKRNHFKMFAALTIAAVLLASCSNILGTNKAALSQTGIGSLNLRIPAAGAWIQAAMSQNGGAKALRANDSAKALSAPRALGVVGKVNYKIWTTDTVPVAVTGGSGTFTPTPFYSLDNTTSFTQTLSTPITLNAGNYTIDVDVFNNSADVTPSVHAVASPFTVHAGDLGNLTITCVPVSPTSFTVGASALGIGTGLTTAFTTTVMGSERWFSFTAANTTDTETKITIDATGTTAKPAFAVFDAAGNYLASGSASAVGGIAVATPTTTNGQVYYIGVIDNGGTGLAASRGFAISGINFTPPAAPTGLVEWRTTDRSVDFYWTTIAGATGYKVYKGSSATDPNPTYYTTVTGEEATISGFTPGQTYYLYMRGIVGGADTLLSSCLTGTTLASATLTAPTLTQPVAADITDSAVTLTWNDSSPGASYMVFLNGQYMGDVSGLTSTFPTSTGFGLTASYSIPGSLKGATSYKFYLVAYSGGTAVSAPSNEITVVTAPVSATDGLVAFNDYTTALANVLLNTPVSGTYGSGNLTLTTGGKLTFTNYLVGSYTINGVVNGTLTVGTSYATASGTLTFTNNGSSDGPVASMVLTSVTTNISATPTSTGSATSVLFNGAIAAPTGWALP